MHLYDPFPPWFLFLLDFSGSADVPPWFTATESARLRSDELRWLINRPPDQDNESMLALFVGMAFDEEGAADQHEWRALAQSFPQMNIYLAECAGSDQQMSSICAELLLCRLSRPTLPPVRRLRKQLRQCQNGHSAIAQIHHYVRQQIHAADGTAGTLWVDDFVPWCPPCLRLLAELRKLPAEVDGRPPWLNCEAEVTTICRNTGTRRKQEAALEGRLKADLYSYGTLLVVGYGALFLLERP
ncbi:hypothetical protein niasHT_016977 [Heterodera trifolii]|uniref:Uncharacterized protein n=1 Tax=Heterodera trifolii TaxID=157864 RepID=A0ABD2LAM8_9BILA